MMTTSMMRSVSLPSAFGARSVASFEPRYASIVRFGLRFCAKRIAYGDDKRELGKWLCDETADMGPLFVKLGQFISSRKDVIDPDIAEALSKLQDSAPPFVLEEEFESELESRTGGTLQARDPIACASVAGVFKGEYRGKKAVFKVLRPGIRENFGRDLEAITSILGVAQRLGVRQAGAIRSLVAECKPMLDGELDMRNEAGNLRAFKKSLSDVDWVRVPDVFYEDGDVLVMEYLSGRKITDLEYIRKKGIDPAEMATKLMTAFTIQVIRNGIFHADPHPGNIGIGKDGSVLFYDLGSMIRIKKFRSYFMEFARAAATEDVPGMLSTMERMEIVSAGEGPEGRRLMRGYVREILRYMRSGDARSFHNGIVRRTGDGSSSTGEGGVGRGVNLDWRFVYLSRAMTMVEGACKDLDPDFNYSDFLKFLLPNVRVQSAMTSGSAMSEGARVISDIAGAPRMIRDLSDMVEDQGEATSRERARVRTLSSRVDVTNAILAALLAYVALSSGF